MAKWAKKLPTLQNRGAIQYLTRLMYTIKADLSDWQAGKVDAAVEFTTPAQAYDNIKLCIDKGIPVISGTTGWLDKKE